MNKYKISISTRENDMWLWAGNGTLTGDVVGNCDAVLGETQDETDEIYDAIGIAAHDSEDMSGTIKVCGAEYRWELEEEEE